MSRRRYRFDPNRTRPRTAAERLHRKRVAGVLKMLKREIKEAKQGEKQ